MATQIDHFINSRSRGLDPVVIVEDAIMGTGKSSGIIKEFQAQCQVGTQFNRPVIVVLRYLDEITRFKKECPAMNWHEPSDTKGKKKEDIKTLLSMGYNILTTHKLFDAWDVEIRDAIFLSKYKIVIDEVVTCLESVDITPTALQEAEKAGLIRVQEQGKHKEVIWIGATDTYDGAFENLKRKCSDNVINLRANYI